MVLEGNATLPEGVEVEVTLLSENQGEGTVLSIYEQLEPVRRGVMDNDLQELIDQVRSLPAEDQKRIREAIDEELSRLAAPVRDAEEEFKRRLVAAGLLKEVKRPVRDVDGFRSWQPVRIQGKPLSETIIEERR